jgi:uncharacterized SAM-binding protein YcdF (DUF218 family)
LKRRHVIAIGAAIIATVATARFAGTLLVLSRPLEHPEAILSLASHEWERLPATAALASRYPSALVLLTLPQRVTIHNCHDCGGRVGRLQRLGVTPDRVRIVPLSAPGTYGEALATSTFVREAGIHRLVIVTTPYHTRRAFSVFRSVFEGSDVAIGIAPAATSPARPGTWWRDPYDRAYVAYEWAAALYYAAWYQVMIWP